MGLCRLEGIVRRTRDTHQIGAVIDGKKGGRIVVYFIYRVEKREASYELMYFNTGTVVYAA